MKRAVVVFSGGQDSTTCLIQALEQYDDVHCVTFDYGQRHREEIDVARDLAIKLGARAQSAGCHHAERTRRQQPDAG